MNNNNNNRFI